jgi:Flp pilus assembly protein TadB
MSAGFGVLMFFYSMGCLLIGAFIAYKIINRKTDEEKSTSEE